MLIYIYIFTEINIGRLLTVTVGNTVLRGPLLILNYLPLQGGVAKSINDDKLIYRYELQLQVDII